MLAYPFLVLSLLFLLPGVFILVLRRDLWPVMRRVGLCSLPFALTEFLFYPTYWKPRFLWDLVEVLGFGLEDFLFVVGLAAFTSTGYAFVFRRRYVALKAGKHRSRWRRCVEVLSVTFVSVAILALLGIPMIYGSCLIMIAMYGWMVWGRRDLAASGLWGALITTVVYTGLCMMLGWLIPDVFAMAWNTEAFLNLYVWGVPVEELMYASTSGLVATCFYPYIFGYRWESMTTVSTQEHQRA